jgi:hypothetical protein
MIKTFLLPDDIFKKILSMNNVIVKKEQKIFVERILLYYDTDIIAKDLIKRKELEFFITKALKFNYCINLLQHDEYFVSAYETHKNNNRDFTQMDWINSLIISIWMYKFH